MRYGLVVLTALAVLASGCASQSNPESDLSADVESPDEDLDQTSDLSENESEGETVYFTDEGFQPSTVTVDKGETVTWISNTSTSMWVASDRHPDHTEYAGSSREQHCEAGDQNEAAFDQCSTGERFSFTFEKTGTWGYHNHRPYLPGGTVEVVE